MNGSDRSTDDAEAGPDGSEDGPSDGDDGHRRVELVARADHRVGEGPLWHPDEQRLYWVDIPTGRLFRLDPEADTYERVLSLDRALGGCTLQADGSFALFTGRGGVALWDGADPSWVLDSIPGERDSRFNDVVADPEGRVFAGTMPTEAGLGALYRVDPDGSYEVVDERGFDIPNGMGFSPDLETLYVTESEARRIYSYDYDRATGGLDDRSVFARVPDGEGVPDGLTVDAEGDVWSARWGGGCVVRHAPDGTVRERVPVPAPKVSAAAFGGADHAELFLTTAKGHDAEDQPPAGSVFRTRPDVGGGPAFRSEIGHE